MVLVVEEVEEAPVEVEVEEDLWEVVLLMVVETWEEVKVRFLIDILLR